MEIFATNCLVELGTICLKYLNTESLCEKEKADSINTLDWMLDPKLFLYKSYVQSTFFNPLSQFSSDQGMTSVTYESMFEALWYSSLPCFDVENVTADFDGTSSMPKYCEPPFYVQPFSQNFPLTREFVALLT